MWGFHWPELLLVLLLGLVIFGPKRLPEIGHGLGKSIRDFRESVSGDDTEAEATKLPPPDEPVNRTG